MNILNIKIHTLQEEMDKRKEGYCLLIKILNYNELISFDESGRSCINDLNHIIQTSLNKYSIKVYRQINGDNILIVMPMVEKELLGNLVWDIYLTSQLHTRDTMPWYYLNCRISTIEFPKCTNDAKKIFNILNWLSDYPNDYRYHRHYSDEIYDIEANKTLNSKVNLLRKSLANNSVVFAYQPIIHAINKNIDHYECLLRIPDENGKLISIGPIIAEAENKGLCYALDKIVLEMTINELLDNPKLILAVNISNIGISDDLLLEKAISLLKTYDIGNRLIIEITETSLNDNYTKINDFISSLNEFGCQFALDDFGSGFTSFRQLSQLKVDVIKIDGSYVRNILKDKQSQYFVSRIIEVASELGITTVAEFVEDEEIANMLIEFGVTAMQGNFFGAASIIK